MKIKLVILCLSLFCLNADCHIQPKHLMSLYPIDMLENVGHALEKGVQLVNNGFVTVTNKFIETIGKSVLQTYIVVTKAMRNFYMTFSKLRQFENLKLNSTAGKNCAASFQLQLKKILSVSDASLELCSEKGVRDIRLFIQSFSDSFQIILENEDKFRMSIVTCLHLNIVTTASCFLTRGNKYYNQTNEIAIAVRDLILGAAIDVLYGVAAFDNCIDLTLTDTNKQIQGIINQAKECKNA